MNDLAFDQEKYLWEAPLRHPERFEGRTAIVTGGSNGIGLATVVRLLREGANVVFCDIDRHNAEKLLQTGGSFGYEKRLRFVPGNVSREEDVSQVVRAATKQFGRLDLMVNNAGASGAIGPLLDTSTEDWNSTMQLLLNSVFWGIRYAGKEMIRRGIAGSVVNIASLAGLNGGLGGAAYSTAKAGVVNLTRCAAIQLGKRNIRCNVICPGNIITPLLLRTGASERMEQAAVKSQAWPAPGRPEDVASVISFLGSDEARYVNGCVLPVDGGCRAGSPALFEWQTSL